MIGECKDYGFSFQTLVAFVGDILIVRGTRGFYDLCFILLYFCSLSYGSYGLFRSPKRL